MKSSRGLIAVLVTVGLVIAAIVTIQDTNDLEQPPRSLWLRTFGSDSQEMPVLHTLALSSDGDVYVTGYTSGQIRPDIPNAGGFDAFIARYTLDGVQSWVHQFGTNRDEVTGDIEIGPDGFVYVTGETIGQLGPESFGSSDGFIAKISPDGHIVWVQQFGTATLDSSRSLAFDSSGDIFVVGHTYGNLNGQVNIGPDDTSDLFLMRLDPNGNHIWTRLIGTDGNDSAQALVIDSAGHLIFTGYTNGQFPSQIHAGDRDIVVGKYTRDGQQVWLRQLGTDQYELAIAVATNAENEIFVGGSTKGALAGYVNEGGTDAMLLKFSPEGDTVWTHQTGTAKDDMITAIAIDSIGEIYATGYAQEDLDPTPQTDHGGNWDAFLTKYNADGSPYWVAMRGAGELDLGADVVFSKQYGLFMSGSTGTALEDQPGHGGIDAFVSRYAP